MGSVNYHAKHLNKIIVHGGKKYRNDKGSCAEELPPQYLSSLKLFYDFIQNISTLRHGIFRELSSNALLENRTMSLDRNSRIPPVLNVPTAKYGFQDGL